MIPLRTLADQLLASVRGPLDAHDYLHERLSRPQRHRLLHGYPLAAAMKPRERWASPFDVGDERVVGRKLLVGVLPHPFCNPAITGCGFCTFPHQSYHKDHAGLVIEAVISEIEQRLARQPHQHGRVVSGLYFGGGTANLSPAEPFRRLCRTLANSFDLTDAEVTLEGVPAYFVCKRPLLIDIMREEIPARHFRISMGIQTFDENRLRQMGRLAFGTADTFRAAVELAHERGMTASADLLYNLPHQSLSEMEHDLEQAQRIGLDHLGLYHLVLFRGLGTAWARDPRMLAGLPTNKAAADNWLHLRRLLLINGFRQTTLTNFEQDRFAGDPRRFVYEEFSFRPDRYEMLGFGPSAISFSTGAQYLSGLKVLNPDQAEDYVEAVRSGGPAWDRYFDYSSRDLRVFHLTRRLAGMRIDRADYTRLFGTDVLQDYPEELAVLETEGLIEVTADTIEPTPRGMFFADSIAALLAWRQLQHRRQDDQRRYTNSNSLGHM